jgi:hypothetical protein
MPATESAPLTGNPEVSAFSFFVICSCLVCVTWLQFSSAWCNPILSRLNVFLHTTTFTLQVTEPPFEPFIKCSIWKLASASHGFACVVVIPLYLLPFNDMVLNLVSREMWDDSLFVFGQKLQSIQSAQGRTWIWQQSDTWLGFLSECSELAKMKSPICYRPLR